jgi:hypothetical protein
MGPTNIGPGRSALWKRAEPPSKILTTFALMFRAIAFIQLISNDLLAELQLDHLQLRQVCSSRRPYEVDH